MISAEALQHTGTHTHTHTCQDKLMVVEGGLNDPHSCVRTAHAKEEKQQEKGERPFGKEGEGHSCTRPPHRVRCIVVPFGEEERRKRRETALHLSEDALRRECTGTGRERHAISESQECHLTSGLHPSVRLIASAPSPIDGQGHCGKKKGGQRRGERERRPMERAQRQPFSAHLVFSLSVPQK